MDIKSEILDRELDAIFKDCARDNSETAQVLTLIDACVDRYADGQPEIKNILLQRMDPEHMNPYISKSVFKRRVKEWMLAASGDQCCSYNALINSEENDYSFTSPDEYEHSISCSTPLRATPHIIKSKKLQFMNDSEYDSSSGAQDCYSLRHEVSVLKDRNDSLESSLLKAEQKINSLESKLMKQDAAHKKQVRSFESEIHRLNTLLTEAQENYSVLQEKYEKLNNDNQIKCNNEILAEAERQKEWEKVKEDLEIKLLHSNEESSKKNSDIKKLESLVYHLKLELSETQESKDTVERELAVLKIQIQSMLYNEEELNSRIKTLECEKQEHIREFSEAAELFQSVNHFNSLQMTEAGEQLRCYSLQEDNRESGISIKSELSDVSGFLSQTCRRIPSLNSLNNDVNDKSSCVLNLLASSRLYAEEEFGISKKISPCCAEKDTQTAWVRSVEKAVQVLPVKLSLDSVETQTEDWTSLTCPCSDFKETQTTEVLTTFLSMCMDSKETQTTEELTRFSSTRSQSICCYAVLSMFLVPMSALFLFIWMNFDRNLVLNMQYPRGPPPT